MTERPSGMRSKVDWQSFLGKHDPLWTVKPVAWEEGAFIGNGRLGAMIYGEENRAGRGSLRFVLGSTEVTASAPDGVGSAIRVPIGELVLKLSGWIYQPLEIRLVLWDAEIRAELTTTRGKVRLRAFVHAVEPVVTVEYDTDEGEKDARLHWYPYPEIHPVHLQTDRDYVNPYTPPIVVERSEERGVSVGVQSYDREAEEGCVTAWQELTRRHTGGRDEVKELEDQDQDQEQKDQDQEDMEQEQGCSSSSEIGCTESRVCFLTVYRGVSSSARTEAIETVQKAVRSHWDSWLNVHRRWWHDYYPRSFLSIPDTRLEGFYWIQMYKLGSAMRSDSLVLDNQGPWLTSTPWPGLWFNMNVQMSYSPVYAANRLDLGQSLVRGLRKHKEQLVRNVPEHCRHDSAGLGRSGSYDLNIPVEEEVGNLTWLLHSVWRHYRCNLIDELLRDTLYPLLRRSVGYYLHLLEEEGDGQLHLPPTVSPEYGSFAKLKVADCHYDLALLRWGCETLLDACERLKIEDPLQEKWEDVLTRLAPYPTDETGFMIGRDVPLAFGHRHFSHLLAVFPLHLLRGEEPGERELILRSLRHWVAREGDLRGFTFTAAASIAASLGLGNEANAYLQTLLHMITPNTMYKEAGPVIETPLAAAEALHDMLLQSWDGTIRVFPAVPDAWRDCSFHDLRAEGAFLVSAVRRGGNTVLVRIKSMAGEHCLVRTGWTGAVQAKTDSGIVALEPTEGVVRIALQAGEEALLFPDGEMPDFSIVPVADDPRMHHFYGGRKPWRLYGLPIE